MLSVYVKLIVIVCKSRAMCAFERTGIAGNKTRQY